MGKITVIEGQPRKRFARLREPSAVAQVAEHMYTGTQWYRYGVNIEAWFNAADDIAAGVEQFAHVHGTPSAFGELSALEAAYALMAWLHKQPPAVQEAIDAYYRARRVTR